MSKIRLSVDDGCASDVRVAELAKRYGIECVFYWPVEHRSLAYDNEYEPLHLIDQYRIANEFEIGSHTVTHRHLTKLNEIDAMIEIFDSQAILQKQFGQSIKKFCPPRGYTNKELTKYTLTFYQSQRLTKGSNLIHVHPNSGGNENKEWREFANAKTKFFDEIELWFHSWELDRFNLWDELEEYLKANI